LKSVQPSTELVGRQMSHLLASLWSRLCFPGVGISGLFYSFTNWTNTFLNRGVHQNVKSAEDNCETQNGQIPAHWSP